MESQSIWQDGASQFMAIQHLSQERALHPAVLDLIESSGGKKLLDFGCGDGRVLDRLSDRWVIDAFDPSPQMREIALRRVGHRLNRMFSTPTDFTEKYDVVLLGMVILCIPTVTQLHQVFQDCANVMHHGSRLFVTTTHPCFRDRQFSNFTTAFSQTQPFRYLEEAQPYQVTLQDPDSEGVTFTDYHWSLGFTVDSLARAGLALRSLFEVPDDPESPDRNQLVPPFLILDCTAEQ